jgi:hypothetical protein
MGRIVGVGKTPKITMSQLIVSATGIAIVLLILAVAHYKKA